MSDELDRLEAEVRKAQEHESDLTRQQAEAADKARKIEAELVALAALTRHASEHALLAAISTATRATTSRPSRPTLSPKPAMRS